MNVFLRPRLVVQLSSRQPVLAFPGHVGLAMVTSPQEGSCPSLSPPDERSLVYFLSTWSDDLAPWALAFVTHMSQYFRNP